MLYGSLTAWIVGVSSCMGNTHRRSPTVAAGVWCVCPGWSGGYASAPAATEIRVYAERARERRGVAQFGRTLFSCAVKRVITHV
eukprot:3329781-Prymnesium_polylepis.1